MARLGIRQLKRKKTIKNKIDIKQIKYQATNHTHAASAVIN
jgi:hypothetical protein